MGGRLRHGSCTAGCGENERAAVGEPDAEHFNGAGDSFQIQSGRDCVLRTKQDAAGCPAERGTGGISEEALRSGLQKASWKGRFTVLQREPYFIIDGAHNRDGAKVLADSVRQYFPKKKLHYIMGVFKDKEYETIIAQMSAFDADVITVETPGNPRALPAEELAEAWKKKKADVTFEKKIENAVRKSLEKAKKDDVILAFGSLSFLGEIVKALDTIRSEV